MNDLCNSLLREWCEALLKLQIKDTGDPRLDGALLCPACGRIHGRCFEGMYPFLYLASADKEVRWMEAAEKLFIWAEKTLSQTDGSFFNDIDSDWKGTTVFNTIQLADCLLLHSDLLNDSTKRMWTERLHRAAEFLYRFDELKENNINYPISNALALYECGVILKEKRYIKKAGELADIAETVMTERGLLLGEGIPHLRESPNGCYPVDIGYNVEETLPSLALYASLSGNSRLLDLAERGLAAQLEFMLENGAWDNSFGTRNFKWTYWGSRTSDGCALGYLIFAENHSEFALAARKNLLLLKQCTYCGLLMGGPHYQQAGQAACVHHTFTHAKVLAGILDRKLCTEKKEDGILPRQKVGNWHDPYMKSWLINRQSMTATITAYDWEYLKGGHASGGTLCLLHHNQVGTLLCSGVNQYMRKEPNNMQIPYQVKHECLALRIEARIEGVLYSSLYEDCAQVVAEENEVTVRGCLKDIHHKKAPGRELQYGFIYQLEEHKLTVQAVFSEGILICPLVSREDERISYEEGGNSIQIQKGDAVLFFQTTGQMSVPYGTERVFNLVPGMQALRIDLLPDYNTLEFQIMIVPVT